MVNLLGCEWQNHYVSDFFGNLVTFTKIKMALTSQNFLQHTSKNDIAFVKNHSLSQNSKWLQLRLVPVNFANRFIGEFMSGYRGGTLELDF